MKSYDFELKTQNKNKWWNAGDNDSHKIRYVQKMKKLAAHQLDDSSQKKDSSVSYEFIDRNMTRQNTSVISEIAKQNLSSNNSHN